jgi:hypothetical protein
MPPVKKHKAGSNPNPSKLGRKGDSRMESALNARLADSKMPLQKALEQGGFVFTRGRDGIVYDKDNVRLSQRKNQLSRRIRTLKSQTNPCSVASEGSYSDATDVKIPAVTKKRNGRPANISLHSSDQNSESHEAKLNRALTYFSTEVATLFKKSLLSSGFSVEQTEECDELYLEFAEKAIESERRRVARLKSRMYPPLIETSGTLSQDGSKDGSSLTFGHHAHSHSHDHAKFLPDSESDSCLHSRHLHRLEGRCGHRAIIHKPASGHAHIDFVVDDKIECYQDCTLLTDEAAYWPSKFRCDELGDHQHKDDNSKGKCDGDSCKIQTKPKLLDLSQLDLFGEEWQEIVSSESDRDEEMILGSLFQLSEH